MLNFSDGTFKQPDAPRSPDAHRDVKTSTGPDAQRWSRSAEPHPRLHFIITSQIQKARIQKFSGSLKFLFINSSYFS